jgi:hypothetical protein
MIRTNQLVALTLSLALRSVVALPPARPSGLRLVACRCVAGIPAHRHLRRSADHRRMIRVLL